MKIVPSSVQEELSALMASCNALGNTEGKDVENIFRLILKWAMLKESNFYLQQLTHPWKLQPSAFQVRRWFMENYLITLTLIPILLLGSVLHNDLFIWNLGTPCPSLFYILSLSPFVSFPLFSNTPYYFSPMKVLCCDLGHFLYHVVIGWGRVQSLPKVV